MLWNIQYWIHPLSKEKPFSMMVWCSFYLSFAKISLNSGSPHCWWVQIFEGLKVFNLFSLLENETLQMLNMPERRKHKSGRTKVCKAEEGRRYFVNSKIETDVFDQCVNYIICSLDFRDISWTVSALHLITMNGVIS